MIIYGEYLFAENFITGIVILYFTGKIAGYKKVWRRMILCGVCCGAYSFVLFIEVNGIISFLGKIFFAAGISWLAFGQKSVKGIMQGGILFFLVTFFYGGITLALLSTFGWEGISALEGLYLPPITYFTVTVSGTAAVLMVELTISLIRTRRRVERTSVEVNLRIEDRNWQMKGFIDSGNLLREPLTGKPVAVVSRTLMKEIKENTGDDPARYAAIPYKSVGVVKGIMEGYRIDELKVQECVIRKPVLAAGEETGEWQIILPETMLERGIYAETE